MSLNNGPLWEAFKRDIRNARTKRPQVNTKAVEALKSRTIATTPDAELDYSAYLSDTFINRRKAK